MNWFKRMREGGRGRSFSPLLFVLIGICSAGHLCASSVSWNGNSGTDWAVGANWSTGFAPGTTTADSAIFSGTPPVNQPQLSANAPSGTGSITDLQFLSSGWTLGGNYQLTLTGSTPLTSAGSGTNTISANLNFAAASHSVSVGTGNTLVTSGTISSGANTTKTGAGTWRIDGTIASPFVASDGVVELNHVGGNAILDNTPIRSTGASTVIRWLRADQVNASAYLRTDTGGTFDLNGNNQSVLFIQAGQASTNANGTISTGAGTLTLTNTANTGVVRYAFDSPSFQTGRNGTLTLDGKIALGTGVQYWNIGDGAATSVEVRANAAISGTGGVVLQGVGTLELNGANTYSGNTTISKSVINSTTYNAGTLIVNGGATGTSSGTGTGTVTVGATGRIAGTGTIGQTGRTGTTLSLSGTSALEFAAITPGNHTDANTVGTLSVNGDVSLGDYTEMTLELKSLGTSDALAASGSFSLSATGTVLRLTLLNGETLGGSYTLVSSSAFTGTFSSVYYNGVLVADPTAMGSIGGTHQLTYVGNTMLLVVPEPGTTSLLLAAGLTVFVCCRRRIRIR